MFIDYVTLMLINMSAGLFILAMYLYKGYEDIDQARWAPAFGISGLVATVCGLHMIWHWPLPGAYNSAFGESSVLLGVLFLGTAVALAKKWDLQILAIYGFFAGIAALIFGAGIVIMSMTKAPLMAGAGFILSGMGGIFAFPALHYRKLRALRHAGSVVMCLASLIWLLTAVGGIWGHLESFAKYMPK